MKKREMNIHGFLKTVAYAINRTRVIRNPIKVMIVLAAILMEVFLSWNFTTQAAIPSLMMKGAHDSMPVMMMILYFAVEIFAVPLTAFGISYFLETQTFLSGDKKMKNPNREVEVKVIEKKVPMTTSKPSPKKVEGKNVIRFDQAKKMAYMKRVEQYGKEL